jgi:hypothetical protein
MESRRLAAQPLPQVGVAPGKGCHGQQSQALLGGALQQLPQLLGQGLAIAEPGTGHAVQLGQAQRIEGLGHGEQPLEVEGGAGSDR